MAALQAFVTSNVLVAFCIIGIAVTTCVLCLRVYVRITKQNRLLGDDFALFAAVLLYIALASAYITDVPYMYPVMDWLGQKIPFNESLVDDYANMIRYNWAIQVLYWAVLWMVKISLLLFFRRMIMRTHGMYMRVWWAILTFTVVAFVGCVVTLFTACDSIADNFILGHCVSTRNTSHQIASLYYSFAVDVITNLAIMALPLRIVARLNVPRRKDKYKLAALFSVQSIAIVFSVLRVAFTWARTGFKTPSPPWLGIWALAEGMVAIIVGCIPAVSQIFQPGATSSNRTAEAARPSLNSPQSSMQLNKSEKASPVARQDLWFEEPSSSEMILMPLVAGADGARRSLIVPRPTYHGSASRNHSQELEPPVLEPRH